MKNLRASVAVLLGGLFLASGAAQAATDLLSPDLIRARTAPVGQVNVAAPAAATAPAAPGEAAVTPTTAPIAKGAAVNDVGQKIYASKCVICHGTGLAGSPKFGDPAAWKPHIAKGLPLLLQHVHDGFNAMPPKGTCAECSDADLEAAINYMIKHSK